MVPKLSEIYFGGRNSCKKILIATLITKVLNNQNRYKICHRIVETQLLNITVIKRLDNDVGDYFRSSNARIDEDYNLWRSGVAGLSYCVFPGVFEYLTDERRERMSGGSLNYLANTMCETLFDDETDVNYDKICDNGNARFAFVKTLCAKENLTVF